MKTMFVRFREFLEERTGIALEAERAYLIESRLAPVVRASKAESLGALLELVMSGSSPALTRAVIEAMATGETFFFRDRQVFSTFRETILPEILAAREKQKRLRIWCAAASTGQEPYSIAMILDQEAQALRGWQIDLIATDLSHQAIELAGAGIYNQFEVQRGLPVNLLLRYFIKEQDRWKVMEHLRSRVEFRQLNLLDDFSSLGQFDVIFCRNVMMYFDPQRKSGLAARLTNSLNSDGWLFLGATETLSGISGELEADPRAAAVYRRKRETSASATILRFAGARA